MHKTRTTLEKKERRKYIHLDTNKQQQQQKLTKRTTIDVFRKSHFEKNKKMLGSISAILQFI